MMPKHKPDVDERRREILRQLALAEQGEAAAQNALGAKLAQGYFVKKDLPGSLYWYAQAAKQGYTHAKFNAGTMLLAGEGVDILFSGPSTCEGSQPLSNHSPFAPNAPCNLLARSGF